MKNITLMLSLFLISFVSATVIIDIPDQDAVTVTVLNNGTDSNASDCGATGDVLMGSTRGCIDLNASIDLRSAAIGDTNASLCPDDTVLTGDGYCLNLNNTIDDRAGDNATWNESRATGLFWGINLGSANVTYENINTTANIQFLLNATSMFFNRVNASELCILDICIGDWASVNVTGGAGGNPFDQSLNISNNVTFWQLNLTSGWGNVTITESQITDLVHTTDTNISEWKDNLTSSDCGSGKVTAVQTNGSLTCAADVAGGTATINISDQSAMINAAGQINFTGTGVALINATNALVVVNISDGGNQTDQVNSINGTIIVVNNSLTAINISLTNQINSVNNSVEANNDTDNIIALGAITNSTLGWNLNITELVPSTFLTLASALRWNMYDTGTDLVLNVTNGGGDFIIQQDNAELHLHNAPVLANNFEVFHIFSKEADTVTEFVVTKAGIARTSYFIRSLAIAGNATNNPTPFNCTNYTNFIDCNTDTTGPDLYVADDIELNGTIFVGEEVNATRWTNVSITESQIIDLTHFNATYDSLITNASTNWTERTRATYNETWSRRDNQTLANINTTANIQFLLNATSMFFKDLNASQLCILDVCIGDWGSVNISASLGFTNLAWQNQSNEFVGQQNITGLLNLTGDMNMTGSLRVKFNFTINDSVFFDNGTHIIWD